MLNKNHDSGSLLLSSEVTGVNSGVKGLPVRGTDDHIAKAMDKPITGSNHATMLKYTSLVVLMVQNAAQTLVMRYVRTRAGDMFMSTTAVVMSELIKTVTCLGVILYEEGWSVRRWGMHLKTNIWDQPLDCVKISVPAIVYMIQNNLLYVAASNLEAATYQVTYQLKILTTALFSVVMLRKELTKLQWVSLVILFIGIAGVQLQPPGDQSSTSGSKPATDQNALIGFLAVAAACVMSGFAGVYFEKLLKNTPQSVFLRNVQLGFIGCVFGCVTTAANDWDKVRTVGFFHGYDLAVWSVILLMSLGGLVVAVVVKYADNILKGFATSGSIIIACVASMYLFDFQLSVQFSVGTALVLIAVYMYSKFVPVPKASPSKASASKTSLPQGSASV